MKKAVIILVLTSFIAAALFIFWPYQRGNTTGLTPPQYGSPFSVPTENEIYICTIDDTKSGDFVGYKRTSEFIALTGTENANLVERLNSGSSYRRNVSTACFDPGLGIKFTVNGYVFDLAVCLHCENFISNANGNYYFSSNLDTVSMLPFLKVLYGNHFKK